VNQVAQSDFELLAQHRKVWDARPELRAIYQEWFAQLLACVDGLHPIVEIGAGAGFFKEYCPSLTATDIVSSGYPIDVISDACVMPFRSGTVGALVMLDVLHHLPKPLEFMSEARRVLQPGGRLAMIEPWITPPSYLLYRYCHHEQCSLKIDVCQPFEAGGKNAFDGNAAIPFKLLQFFRVATPPLRLIRTYPFIGLPYLATLGFQMTRPIPQGVIAMARVCERLFSPLRKFTATRILMVWERSGASATD
jgi:SAM-dependent methyltransferase